MIDDPPLLEIAAPSRRPSLAEVNQFRGAPTSFIVDAMGGRGAMDWRIKPVGQVLPFAGVALTCHCGPADNLALCAAVAQCQKDDVLIAATDQCTVTSVVGDLLLGIAANRGAVAFVTDGLVRDQNDIEALGLPCYAMGATPNSPARNGPGSVGLPVTCGGLPVASGDVIVGDRDGVVVVPHALIDDVVSRLAAVRESEAAMLAKVKGGLSEVGFIADLLAGDRVRRIGG
ncbi:MAG: RraA family protein [Alphaproteobacteria bacterium]|nr:RraA family protein [Alphaproteobacteria bacterium]